MLLFVIVIIYPAQQGWRMPETSPVARIRLVGNNQQISLHAYAGLVSGAEPQ